MAHPGFRINHAEIRRMTHEIEREIAKHPVRVPLEVGRLEDLGLNQTEKDELALMRALRQAGALSNLSRVDPNDLELDLSAGRLEEATDLAVSDGFVKVPTFSGEAYLTRSGRDRLQQAATPAVVHNDFAGATITASNIATGNYSAQHVNAVGVDAELLRRFRSEALELIDRDSLSAEALDGLDADLELIDAQIAAPASPKKGLRRALLSLEQFAINTAGGAAAAGLSALIAQLS